VATIEELLGLPPSGVEWIEKATPERLAEYLKDIKDAEPKPRPVPLVLKQAALLEAAEEKEECPIAGSRPKKSSKSKPKSNGLPDKELLNPDDW